MTRSEIDDIRSRRSRVEAIATHQAGRRLADLLACTASSELPGRVHAVGPLDQVVAAHRAVAEGGLRGRYVLKPRAGN